MNDQLNTPTNSTPEEINVNLEKPKRAIFVSRCMCVQSSAALCRLYWQLKFYILVATLTIITWPGRQKSSKHNKSFCLLIMHFPFTAVVTTFTPTAASQQEASKFPHLKSNYKGS